MWYCPPGTGALPISISLVLFSGWPQRGHFRAFLPQTFATAVANVCGEGCKRLRPNRHFLAPGDYSLRPYHAFVMALRKLGTERPLISGSVQASRMVMKSRNLTVSMVRPGTSSTIATTVLPHLSRRAAGLQLGDIFAAYLLITYIYREA